ncbi:hypothetical protein H4R33_000096 [Dimargaris cristalligena]|uniref:UV radiation resistance protein and autophagy-related subunit 14-domain-containing protein n=1 Tax=Dimargaris cristalligena TaxID=215637 RepID=A0A4P9ZT87_9FUNG|nr:hypothetical protein H4R33_000096 [Dimargaris cristalligena]RKP36687.1 UV radiation resistance protein and autophagy-related subunit 14-domain-containing protein [Dimargaris cristalligena]|eukprot:RKP36687.1 UV radiation resistance protein and autophagy-related subunit 14-domain-containing protein [Dimargaris cristalligena]
MSHVKGNLSRTSEGAAKDSPHSPAQRCTCLTTSAASVVRFQDSPALLSRLDELTQARLLSLEERLAELERHTTTLVAQFTAQQEAESASRHLLVQLNGSKRRTQDCQVQLIRDTERLQEARRMADAKRDALRYRRCLLLAARKQAQLERSYLNDSLVTLEQNKIIKEASEAMQRQQLAGYMSGLKFIFDIHTEPNHPAIYRIANLPGPNAARIVKMTDEEINASVGYVSHLVTLLARYLETPLRYPIKFLSSRSIIYNPAADIMRLNIKFPLYTSKNEWTQFDYAFNLLSQNVQQLLKTQGIEYYEHRNILANLKLLLDIIETRGQAEVF